MSFASHINEKITTARKGLGLIKHLSPYLPVSTLDQINTIYVRPHWDFCDVIFQVPKQLNEFDSSIRLNNLMASIERIQYQVAIAITGAWKGTNLNKIYEELGWEPSTDRRWCRRLIRFYKIYNNYLKPPIPPPRRHHLYGTRSNNILYVILCKTDRSKYSFYPHCIQAWNDIGPELRNAASLSAFKTNIAKLIRTP